MDDMQAHMGAILNDPQAMQKIMALAQSLQQSGPKIEEQKEREPQKQPANPGFSFPDIDLGMLQKLTGFAKQSNIDNNQKNLLSALGPYLSRERISKLEKAMRAAKMARMASSVLGQTGFLFGTGR